MVGSTTTVMWDDRLRIRLAEPLARARIRRMVRATAKRSLVYGKALGPNYRTIMLGASMLAGSPLWYYLGQILLMNAILVVSVRHHNAVQRRLVERLG